MSVLGDFVRLSPALLEEIRADPETAYRRMTDGFGAPQRLELDWEWRPLGGLMDAAGFPLNPVRSGSLFPDEDTAFGAEGDAHSLTVDEVAEAAALLQRTPFEELAPHLRTVLEDLATVRVNYDYKSPDFRKPLPPEQVVRAEVPEERMRLNQEQLPKRYRDLVEFFAEAAANGESTVFWAA